MFQATATVTRRVSWILELFHLMFSLLGRSVQFSFLLELCRLSVFPRKVLVKMKTWDIADLNFQPNVKSQFFPVKIKYDRNNYNYDTPVTSYGYECLFFLIVSRSDHVKIFNAIFEDIWQLNSYGVSSFIRT